MRRLGMNPPLFAWPGQGELGWGHTGTRQESPQLVLSPRPGHGAGVELGPPDCGAWGSPGRAHPTASAVWAVTREILLQWKSYFSKWTLMVFPLIGRNSEAMENLKVISLWKTVKNSHWKGLMKSRLFPAKRDFKPLFLPLPASPLPSWCKDWRQQRPPALGGAAWCSCWIDQLSHSVLSCPIPCTPSHPIPSHPTHPTPSIVAHIN